MNKDGDKRKLDLEPHEVKYHEALQNALVFVRQAAEWGMGITVFTKEQISCACVCTYSSSALGMLV